MTTLIGEQNVQNGNKNGNGVAVGESKSCMKAMMAEKKKSLPAQLASQPVIVTQEEHFTLVRLPGSDA